MCYRDTVKKIIFSPLSKKGRLNLIEKALEEFYGKLEVPQEVISLENRRSFNGGLIDKLPDWVH
ncbi:MAG: hypothetical protein PF549_04295 [Patescibacteria group bacterium]|jgi:hypothetical protein|nr:hypothetical protein [Patescibacteria group bacterium]